MPRIRQSMLHLVMLAVMLGLISCASQAPQVSCDDNLRPINGSAPGRP